MAESIPADWTWICMLCTHEINSDQSFYIKVLLKLGLSEKHTKFEKNLPHGFDKLADLLKCLNS